MDKTWQSMQEAQKEPTMEGTSNKPIKNWCLELLKQYNDVVYKTSA
jgi:hypothetical protein